MTQSMSEALAALLNAAGVTPYHKDASYDGNTAPVVDGHIFGEGVIQIPGTVALIVNDTKLKLDAGWGVEWVKEHDIWVAFEKHEYGWC